MRHIDENDIARFADGNISKAEREIFLEHFSQCESCLKAYTDTLKFAKMRKKPLWFHCFPGATHLSVYPCLQSVGIFLKKNLVVPALAFLILLLVIFTPLIRKTITDESNTAKLKYIEECIMKNENQEYFGLFPSKNLINSAIRAGFFIEDLEVVLHSMGKKDLKMKVIRMLETELKKIFADENQLDLSLLGSGEMSKSKFKKIVLKIRYMLKTRCLFHLFQLGRFVERSILDTFEKKTTRKNELEKYLQIVRKYNLPKSIPDKLEEIKKTSGIIERRELWNDIKEVF